MPDSSALLKQTYDDEESSPDWERIKNFVGGAEPKKKHPIAQMVEREQRKVQGYDEGGEAGNPVDGVPPISNDPLLQPRGAGMIAPSAAPMTPAPMPPAAPPPIVPRQPISVPAQPLPARGQPSTEVVSAPTDASYSSEAAKVLGTSPEELKAFLTKNATPGWGEEIGRIGATMGDAFSRAGFGNSNYLEQFNKQKQAEREGRAEIPGKVAELGKERFGLEKELGNDDPKSMRSFVAQNASRGFLKSLGFSDEETKLIPASQIDGLRSGALTRDDVRERIKSEETLKEIGFGLQEKQIEATKEHQRAEEANTAKETGLKADTEASKHWITHPIDAAAARSRLAAGTSGESKATPAHGIPELGQTFNGQKITGVRKIR